MSETMGYNKTTVVIGGLLAFALSVICFANRIMLPAGFSLGMSIWAAVILAKGPSLR